MQIRSGYGASAQDPKPCSSQIYGKRGKIVIPERARGKTGREGAHQTRAQAGRRHRLSAVRRALESEEARHHAARRAERSWSGGDRGSVGRERKRRRRSWKSEALSPREGACERGRGIRPNPGHGFPLQWASKHAARLPREWAGIPAGIVVPKRGPAARFPRVVFLLSSAPPPSADARRPHREHERARLLRPPRVRQDAAMVLLPSSPPSSYHRTAPFPAATTAARPRRGSIRLVAAGRCSGPASLPRNSDLQAHPAPSVGRRR